MTQNEAVQEAQPQRRSAQGANMAQWRLEHLARVALAAATMVLGCQPGANEPSRSAGTERAVRLNQDWDKTFPRSDKVEHKKVTFTNRFGILLVADLYWPKAGAHERLGAIAV